MKKKVGLLAAASLLMTGAFLTACGAHEHTLEDAWLSDDTNHWQVCGECTESVNFGVHTFEAGFCTVCSAEEPVDGSVGLEYSYADYTETTWRVKGIGECTDTIITIPASYRGKPVVAIGFEAFKKDGYDSPMESVTKIVIPSSVTEIGRYAFSYFKGAVEFVNPTITEIGESAFEDYMGAGLVIPDGVTTIGYRAFSNNGGAVSFTIPNTVTHIGVSAFSMSINLEEVIFEDGIQIEELPDSLFNSCEKLKDIEIPASVKRLTVRDDYYLNDWNGTFKDVTGTITFEEGSQLEFIGEYYFLAFKGTVVLPESYKVVNKNAFFAMKGAKVVVTAAVTEIEAKGLSAWEVNLVNYPAHSIYYMGTAAQWDAIVKGSDSSGSAVGESAKIYMSNEWEFVDGIPTVKAK